MMKVHKNVKSNIADTSLTAARGNASRRLAAQLHCPEGEEGMKISGSMFVANKNMIYKTINSLGLERNDKILEIGFGNGKHIPFVLRKASGIEYTGAGISTLMAETAAANNTKHTASGKARFLTITENETLPFSNNYFNKIFSVNTLYFWQQPLRQMENIFCILHAGGRLSLGFAAKESVQQVPFAQYGFMLYDINEVIQLFKDAGFSKIIHEAYEENTRSNAGQKVHRAFNIISGRK